MIYSQNALVDAGMHCSPAQHGGQVGGHSMPFGRHRGAFTPPLPESWIVCGLPAALSLTVTFPLTSPAAAGENATSISHVAFGASDAPHVLVTRKPESTVIPAICNVAKPVLVRITGCALAVVPIICCPKLMLVADRSTSGAPPGMLLEQAASTTIPINVKANKLLISHLPIGPSHRWPALEINDKGPRNVRSSSVDTIAFVSRNLIGTGYFSRVARRQVYSLLRKSVTSGVLQSNALANFRRSTPSRSMM